MNVFRVASYSVSGDYATIVSMEPERTQMFDGNGYFLRKPNELRAWILKNRVTICTPRSRSSRLTASETVCVNYGWRPMGVGLRNYGREPHCIWPRKDAGSAQV